MKQDKRLAKLFQPAHYELSFDIDSKKLHFKGRAKITGELVSASDHLLLHSVNQKISSVEIDQDVYKDHKLLDDDQQLRIYFTEKLKPTELTITIQYEAEISEAMVGIYSSYYHQDKKKHTIISTQFESHYARQAFPCIDEPSAKATFQLSIEADKELTVLSNTDPIKRQNTKTRKTTHFDKTPLMSTYLVAFTVGRLSYVETKTKRDVRVRIYSTPLQKQHLGFAKEVAVSSLELMEKFFGQKYELNKCDLVAIPDFSAGAMENWGLCIFRETALVYDEKSSSLAAKKMVAQVIVHELAHQWFGNLVTMKWWDDLWLKESFARFMESYITDKLYSEWHFWEDFVSNDFVHAQNLDRLSSTHPIKLKLDRAEDIRSKYDAISYDKGSAVLRMLFEYIGEAAFDKGLKHYIATFKYKNAESDDLWQSLSKVSKKDAVSFMKAWTSNTGFPVLSLSQDGEEFSYEQKRYFVTPQEDKQLWPIPINLEKDLITERTGKLDLEQPLLINSNHGGFYITNYANDYLKKLINTPLTATEKTGLVNDLLHLVRSGDKPTIEMLELLPEFVDDESLAVVESVVANVGITRRSMIVADEDREAYYRFMRNLFRDSYARYGWHRQPKETDDQQLIRSMILAAVVLAEHQPALDEALSQFQALQTVEDVDPNQLATVLSAGAKHLGEEGYDKLVKLSETTTTPHAKRMIDSSMTATKDEVVVKKLLVRLENETRLQDLPSQLFGLMANREATDLSWRWLKKNWTTLRKRFGQDIMSLGAMPQIAGASFMTHVQLSEFDKFFKAADTKAIEDKVQQARDSLAAKLDWQDRDQQTVVDWLASR